MITYNEYVNDVERRCPFCNSSRAYSWDSGHCRQQASFVYTCQDCEGEWEQHYEMTRVTYTDRESGLQVILGEEE